MLSFSCSSLQKLENKSTKSFSTFENKHIKFNYSKDWLIFVNDSIKDEINLTPISSIKTNDFNGVSIPLAKFVINSKKNVSFIDFRKNYTPKKRVSRFSNKMKNQTSHTKIKWLSEYHYVEKTRINIARKTGMARNFNFFYTAHHFFKDNNNYTLFFENDYKKTTKNKKQAKIIFDSFEIK